MAYVPSTRTSRALPAKGVEAEMRRGFAVVDGAVSKGRVVLDVHIPRLDELLVREPVLGILDGSERPRPLPMCPEPYKANAPFHAFYARGLAKCCMFRERRLRI